MFLDSGPIPLSPINTLYLPPPPPSCYLHICLSLPAGERCKLRAGTPSYIAPEVIAKNYGAEADVWSAGVMLYVMLCGLPPFWGETTEDVFKSILWQPLDFETEPWPSVSAAAKDLVRRMLCRQYMRRITVPEILSECRCQRLRGVLAMLWCSCGCWEDEELYQQY